MSDLNNGRTTREAEFKSNVTLSEVKQTIFASLVPRGDIDIKIPEELSLAYLKEHYPESHLFIQSLEEEQNLFLQEGGK